MLVPYVYREKMDKIIMHERTVCVLHGIRKNSFTTITMKFVIFNTTRAGNIPL